jgi:hypothetical protein
MGLLVLAAAAFLAGYLVRSIMADYDRTRELLNQQPVNCAGTGQIPCTGCMWCIPGGDPL